MATAKKKAKRPQATPSDPTDRLKIQLAKLIRECIKDRGITQLQASFIMNDAQSQVSLVCGLKLRGFSVERLMRMLLALGWDIAISAKETRSGKGRLTMPETQWYTAAA